MVGAVIVGNLICGLIGWLLFTTLLARTFSEPAPTEVPISNSESSASNDGGTAVAGPVYSRDELAKANSRTKDLEAVRDDPECDPKLAAQVGLTCKR